MELWIRSQDRTTLIRSYEIYITEYSKDSYVIRAKRTSHVLGAYKTMQRALEILDEIQNLLQPKIIYTQQAPIETYELGVYQLKQDVDMKIQEVNRIVYEMPKE